MAEPYKRVGRGGAGNYVPKDAKTMDLGRQSQDLDLERNDSNPNAIEGASLEQRQRTLSGGAATAEQYVRTGRGGVGNMANADDVGAAERDEAAAAAKQQQQQQRQEAGGYHAESGGSSSSNVGNDNDGRDGKVSLSLSGPAGAAPLTRGRGGAGNYAGLTDEDRERKRRDEENRAHEMAARARRDVEGEVDGLIKPPGKAMVNQGRGRGEEV